MTAIMLLASICVYGQDYIPARTEYGSPDLSGVWNYSSDIPMERSEEYADRKYLTPDELETLRADREKMLSDANDYGVGYHNLFWLDFEGQVENLRTSLIVYPEDGRLPELQDGIERINPAFGIGLELEKSRPVRFYVDGIGTDGPEDRGLFERCIMAETGPPIVPQGDNNYLQIIQNADHVVILTEHIHEARIVYLDGRPDLHENLRSWSGTSRGYWENDTLVIETKNFNGLTQSFHSSGTSLNKTVTERLRRISVDVIEYTAEISDPATFKDKIVISYPIAKTDARIYEFACHEGNYSMPMTLRGARTLESLTPP